MQPFSIFTSELFDAWFAALADKRTARLIQARIDRVELGHLGDHKLLGQGVIEMRIHHGPGWRVYATKRNLRVIVLLAGGNKSTQQQDIQTAWALARQLKD